MVYGPAFHIYFFGLVQFGLYICPINQTYNTTEQKKNCHAYSSLSDCCADLLAISWLKVVISSEISCFSSF